MKYRSIGTADRTTTGWVHGAPVSGQGSDDPTRRLAAGRILGGDRYIEDLEFVQNNGWLRLFLG